jgi:hypothetical protein
MGGDGGSRKSGGNQAEGEDSLGHRVVSLSVTYGARQKFPGDFVPVHSTG